MPEDTTVHGFDFRPLARAIATEIAAASRALEFARERAAEPKDEGHPQTSAINRRAAVIRLQYCEAWVKSLTTIARSLP